MMEKVADQPKLDPRIKRTRQLLRQAMMALMMEKSFQAITVQDIADRATVNRVTFYAHFEDKYALLEDTMRTMFQERLRAALPEGSRLTPENLARLIELVAVTVTEFAAHCPPPRGQFEALMEKQIKDAVYETLRGWLAERPRGRARPRPTLDQVATIASWAIYGAAVEWGKNDPRPPAGEFAQQVLPLIVASLQTVTQLLAETGCSTWAAGKFTIATRCVTHAPSWLRRANPVPVAGRRLAVLSPRRAEFLE